MKNKIIMGAVLTSALLITTPVSASGTAKVEFTGGNNIKVGDTFTINMNVTDINDTYDGVVSMGGNLSFDSNMIEYVSSKGIKMPYTFQINEKANYKIAGLDFTLDNGIRETLTVYEFTFKALQEGTTTITLQNAKLTDSQDYITTSVLDKEIEIKKEMIVEEAPIVENVVATIKDEISENSNTKISNVYENTIKRDTIEEKITERVEVTNQEEVETNTVEDEKEVKTMTIIEKIQNAFNKFFINLKKLFR